MRVCFAALTTLVILLIAPPLASAQRQLPDREFRYEIGKSAYPNGDGPQILLSTTNNPYVQRGSMDPFTVLLESDGYNPRRQEGSLVDELKTFTGILVIANPYSPDFRAFPAMEPPSAFTDEEIEAVRVWVEDGGSLLILADHAPFGGGSSALAAAFGFTFLNGYLLETATLEAGFPETRIDFTASNGLNTAHPITDGSTGRPAITRFFTFTGQAFIPSEGAVSLLTVPDGWSALFTYSLVDEISSAMRIDASGMSQGAAAEFGSGRVAVFGETGGFTAQVIDGVRRMGFNTREGEANPELVLATLRWLANYSPR